MKKQAQTVQGHSFVFNALFVLLNVIGLTICVLGAQPYFEASYFWMNFIGYTLLGLSAAGLLIFQGKLMMANVARLLVGGVFIVSGVIKANDPVGFAYKLEEYFQDGALAFRFKEWFGNPSFSLEFFADHALFLAVVLCILEIVLGVLTITGAAMRKVAWLLLGLMVFFTFLTWHTASCDSASTYTDRSTYSVDHPKVKEILSSVKQKKTTYRIVEQSETQVTVDEERMVQCVTDCGCFGDAMKGAVGRSLTPWESFWKDCVLMYLIVWILFAARSIQPNRQSANWWYFLATLGLSVLLSWVFDWYAMILIVVVVLVSALWMMRSGGHLLGNAFGSSILVTLLSIGFVSYVLIYDPIKDYRPFSVGSNLTLKMNDGKEGKYASVFVLREIKTGQEKSFSEKDYMAQPELWDTKKYTFISRDQKEVVPGRLASLTDQFIPTIRIEDIGTEEMALPGFSEQLLLQTKTAAIRLKNRANNSIVDVAVDSYTKKDFPNQEYEWITRTNVNNPNVKELTLTSWILEQPIIFVVSSLELSDSDKSAWKRIGALATYAKSKKIPIVLLTRGSRKSVLEFCRNNQVQLASFTIDEKGLMMISRSNPNMMIVKRGIVKAKYPSSRIPDVESLKRKLQKK